MPIIDFLFLNRKQDNVLPGRCCSLKPNRMNSCHFDTTLDSDLWKRFQVSLGRTTAFWRKNLLAAVRFSWVHAASSTCVVWRRPVQTYGSIMDGHLVCHIITITDQLRAASHAASHTNSEPPPSWTVTNLSMTFDTRLDCGNGTWSEVYRTWFGLSTQRLQRHFALWSFRSKLLRSDFG